MQPGLPLNVIARSDPATISESLARSAMCAAPMVTGGLPKAFSTLIRSRCPPMLVRAIMRTV
jgi:hypothetical protein